MKLLSFLTVIITLFLTNANIVGASPNESRVKWQTSSFYPLILGDKNFRVNSEAVRKSEAVLLRTENKFKLILNSRNLKPGAYTVWMRVFNEPSLCLGGEGVENSLCSRGSDLADGMDPSVPGSDGISTSSVFWLTGTIVGDDGIIHVSTSVDKNEWPGMVVLGADARDSARQAAWNMHGSEVHVVLRYHGPAAAPKEPVFLIDLATGMMNGLTEKERNIDFLLGRQLNHMLGNCSPEFSESAKNCEDSQLAVFSPLDSTGR